MVILPLQVVNTFDSLQCSLLVWGSTICELRVHDPRHFHEQDHAYAEEIIWINIYRGLGGDNFMSFVNMVYFGDFQFF